MSNAITIDNAAIVEEHTVPVAGTEVSTEVRTESAVSSSAGAFFKLVRNYATLSDVLRMGGALAVAIAMGIFLLEGVEVVNDLYRFLTMLGLTAALTAAGFMMSMVLKEQRGSRVFISLGLLSVPVNFTVFGALIYSVMPLDAMSISYPEFALWQAATATDITMALICGVAVIAPLVWLGYSVLARSARVWLSVTLLLSSAVLIIPVRQELWAALLALGSTAFIWWQCQSNAKNALVLKTAEGRFAIALLFVAPIVVIVRSLFLYEVGGVLVLTLSAGFYFYMRQLMVSRSERSVYSTVLTMLAGTASLIASVSASDMLGHYMASEWSMIFSAALLLLLALDIKTVSAGKGAANKVAVALLSVAACTLVFVSLLSSSSIITVASVVVLVAAAVYGYLYKYNIVMAIAGVGTCVVAAMNAQEMWSTVAQTGWWGIAAAGASAIVAGSLLDRAGTVVQVNG